MIPSRAPDKSWSLRTDSNSWVRTAPEDMIQIMIDNQWVELDRRDAWLLAKRLNTCLDATRAGETRDEEMFRVDSLDDRHGTRYGYTTMKCRCQPCVQYNKDMCNTATSNRMQDPEKKIPHGTQNGYNNYACRCDACKEGNAAAVRKRREAKKAGKTTVVEVTLPERDLTQMEPPKLSFPGVSFVQPESSR